jgi:hypothetical protein
LSAEIQPVTVTNGYTGTNPRRDSTGAEPRLSTSRLIHPGRAAVTRRLPLRFSTQEDQTQ